MFKNSRMIDRITNVEDCTAVLPCVQTPIMCRAGEGIGLKDTNGNDIFIGAVIRHNENLYVIKWSKNRKAIVARSEPLEGKKASWRDFDWIKRLSDKYITMVGTVLFDDEELKARFKGVY